MSKGSRHLFRPGIAIGVLLSCAGARAWGPDGHETTGKLADALIAGSPAATQVRKLIGMSLQQASVWADCAKGVVKDKTTGKFAYKGAGNFPECKPFETPQEEARMAAFVSRNWTQCDPKSWEETCHRQYHYADVAIQHDHYQGGLAGTSDHDIVGSINAAITVLKGGHSPASIHLASKREALLVLSHYVGDIHQPLHVEAVYLNPQGQPVDPDQAATFDPATRTVGGNSIFDHGEKLHAEWDQVPLQLTPSHVDANEVARARAVAPTAGDPLTWSAQWATDTIQSADAAFSGVGFAPEDTHHHWQASLPDGYAASRAALQRTQVVKGGARLAQLLQAIWPR